MGAMNVNWQCRRSSDCGANWICNYESGYAGMCVNCSNYPFPNNHCNDLQNWRARNDCRNRCGTYTGSTANFPPGRSCSGRCYQCDNQFNSLEDCMNGAFQIKGTVECFARCLEMDVINWQSNKNWNFKNYMRSYEMYHG